MRRIVNFIRRSGWFLVIHGRERGRAMVTTVIKADFFRMFRILLLELTQRRLHA